MHFQRFHPLVWLFAATLIKIGIVLSSDTPAALSFPPKAPSLRQIYGANWCWCVPRKSANDECPFREKVQGLQAAVDNQ